MYLVFKHVAPGFPAKDVSNSEFHNIEREVEHDAVEPDDTGPSPPDSLDSCEFPLCVDCY
ncbi:hypothetical protein HanIR_Chr06g0281611 [Helianthus annuus]|nr:hypothetical protein HanIR_Chr06g0281611 [Helianthus annuus]